MAEVEGEAGEQPLIPERLQTLVVGGFVVVVAPELGEVLGVLEESPDAQSGQARALGDVDGGQGLAGLRELEDDVVLDLGGAQVELLDVGREVADLVDEVVGDAGVVLDVEVLQPRSHNLHQVLLGDDGVRQFLNNL